MESFEVDELEFQKNFKSKEKYKKSIKKCMMTLYFLYKHWNRSKLRSKVGDFCYYLDILVIPGNGDSIPDSREW